MRLELIKTLIYYNHLLGSRYRKHRLLYFLVVGVLLVLLSGLSAIVAIFGYQGFVREFDVDFSSAFLVWFLYAEVLIITSRYGYSSLIEPRQLSLFPVKNMNLFFSIFLILFFDLKFLIFLLPVTIFIWTMAHHGLAIILLTICLFAVFYLFLEVIIIDVYLSFAKMVDKYRNHMVFPGMTLLFLLILLNNTDNYFLLKGVPVIGWIGRSIELALAGVWIPSLSYLGLLVVLTLLGFLSGSFIVNRVRF